jgi:hypothetical protein
METRPDATYGIITLYARLVMKRWMQLLVFLPLFFPALVNAAQDDAAPVSASAPEVREYPFSIFDGTFSHFPMRQFDQDYLSAYRMLTRALDEALPPGGSLAAKLILSLFTVPFTHEEAHRAILTEEGIGSISYSFLKFSGYNAVTGVEDETLHNLRDTDLPTFIRLHTAGIESDYALCQRSKELLAFGQDTFATVGFDLVVREILNIAYMSEGLYYPLLEALGIDDPAIVGKEEENELDRDVVGDDVCGMVFHLYNPDAPFSRYKSYDDLGAEEKRFAARIGLRSLLNLANTAYLHGAPYTLNGHFSIAGGLGYSLAPFGDFLDETLYIKYDTYNIGFYARQFENRDTWFPGFGASLVDWRPIDSLSLSFRGHFWMQPEDLDFNTTVPVPGGAVELEATRFLEMGRGSFLDAVGITVRCAYKTAGFMPEVESHDRLLLFGCGLTLRY